MNTDMCPQLKQHSMCCFELCEWKYLYISHLINLWQEKHIKKADTQHLPNLCKIKSENPN